VTTSTTAFVVIDMCTIMSGF